MAVSAGGAVPRLSAVVPTLGLSPWLVRCLEALRREVGDDLEIVLVAPASADLAEGEGLADRVLRTESNAGFAAANNLGMAAARGEYLAAVNDDAIVGEGWCAALLDALERDETAAAAQGVNLALDDPATLDGAGLAWNRSWQAVQIGRGGPAAAIDAGAAREIFGVSATAAIYRRSALERLADGRLEVFDPRLFAYYEDVDLACRLRGAGGRALLVPAATARHAGSTSGERLPGGKLRLLYRNRHLVLARLLGRGFWPHLPRILLRDAADLWNASRSRDGGAAADVVAGLAAAAIRLPAFARLGRPLVPLDEMRRFRID